MPTVLYIGQNPATGTGSPVIVLRHLRRFAADGWAVAVVAEYGGDYRECQSEGWSVHRLCHRRWWWPPYRQHHSSLRWLRLRLLAHQTAAVRPAPDFILSYLAAHSDFSAQLAAHVAQITGVPLHMLVHDDATAFPFARGREAELHRLHKNILRSADTCWFVSPELADCYPSTAPRRRILYPIPEGWAQPASWREEYSRRARLFYAGRIWPEQLPLLARVAEVARGCDGELVLMTEQSVALRAFCETERVTWRAPFSGNREALAHLAAEASGVLVSYADTVGAMPWCATSFPSKLVEYCHLGIPIAITAPADSAVARWAQRLRFPYFFEPTDVASLRDWFTGLRQRHLWEQRAALSLHLAHTEFDPAHIQAELANAITPGTECRAA